MSIDQEVNQAWREYRREYERVWRKSNREGQRLYQRTYYAKHRTEMQEYHRNYYATHGKAEQQTAEYRAQWEAEPLRRCLGCGAQFKRPFRRKAEYCSCECKHAARRRYLQEYAQRRKAVGVQS